VRGRRARLSSGGQLAAVQLRRHRARRAGRSPPSTAGGAAHLL